MPDLNPKPNTFTPGPSLSVGDLNKLRAAIPRLITGGAGVVVKKLGDRVVVALAPNGEGIPGASYLVTVVSIHDNYLICDKDDAQIAVAKPWALRKGVQFPNPDTYSYTYASAEERTATEIGSNPVVTEDQRITPDYTVGEELLVRRLAAARDVDADTGLPLVYVDENNTGRCWAEVG